MLATQLNNFITGGSLKANSIIRMLEFICNVVAGRRCLAKIYCLTIFFRLIIILNMEVISSNVASLIGAPENVDKAPAQSAQVGCWF